MVIAAVPERIASIYLRTLPKRLVVGWAADVAERVLPKFAEKFPKDQRPRLAIAAARASIAKDIPSATVRQAAYAADAAAADAAYNAADADDAADAAYAAYAVYAAADATYAAYAVYAAYAAANAAHAAYNAADERTWQRNRLIELTAI